MRLNKICSILALAVFLGGGLGAAVADDSTAVNPKAAAAQTMIEEAEKARKKAASVDSEWTGTGKLIKKAQLAMKEGNYDQAIKLAEKASDEGMLGYEQGASQKELRIPSYFKY